MSNTKTVMGQAANTQGIPLDITDVFSTYLYEGTGSTQTITNGIDLAGEGGLVWVKNRDTTDAHHLCDTERGSGKIIFSNFTNGQVTNNNTISGFSASGFSLGGDTAVSTNGEDYASWTFRKAPKFFDVVTYTGDGAAGREIAHNLGSVPGFIVVKKTNASGDWVIQHRSLGAQGSGNIRLNSTDAAISNGQHYWGDGTVGIDPTSSVFTVDNHTWVNNSGDTYVAYLFAHNDGDGGFGPDGDADIIKCGSFTDSSSGWSVDLGFEPQFLLTKRADSTGNWEIVDTMRGFTADRSYTRLYPNLSNAEQTVTKVGVNSTGFFSTTAMETNGATIIYMAIRRGTKVPESGTEVFAMDTQGSTGDGEAPAFRSTFPVDTAFVKSTSGGGTTFASRLTGTKYLRPEETSSEYTNTQVVFDYMNGFRNNTVTFAPNHGYLWRRAPGFFDVVAYTGDGTTARSIPHNLGVAPEMMFHKRRNNTNDWYVPDFQNSQLLILNGNYAAFNTSILANYYGSGNGSSGGAGSLVTPDASTFTVTPNANVNGSGDNYIAYLFASLPGISKVGSYTGNGTSQTIDCGFTSGTRFILVKRTDSTGDWYVWDTERGIVAGNDPYLELNTTDAEVTSTDWVDPASSGFIVNGTTINASSASYIFYAIA